MSSSALFWGNVSQNLSILFWQLISLPVYPSYVSCLPVLHWHFPCSFGYKAIWSSLLKFYVQHTVFIYCTNLCICQHFNYTVAYYKTTDLGGSSSNNTPRESLGLAHREFYSPLIYYVYEISNNFVKKMSQMMHEVNNRVKWLMFP